jgi:HemY protein
MMRMIAWFAVLTAAAVAATWLAYRPGVLTLEWQGYLIELPLALAVAAAAVAFVALALVWAVLRRLLHTPGAVSGYFRFRRARRGHEALAAGMIAVSAGDVASARRQTHTALRYLPGEPLAKLLEAETAGLDGDTRRVKAIYADMLKRPETELVALRGLFTEARRSGDPAAARRHAERALRLNPGAAWALSAMLAIHAAEADWPAVLSTLEGLRKARLLGEDEARRKRAAVLTAQALAAEEEEPDAALDLASRALKLDPALVPAAVTAARVLAGKGALRKASKVIERTWALSPHPDLAALQAHARPGDSPLDRLRRVRDLLRVAPGGEEGAVALAAAAIDAHDWTLAREALAEVSGNRPRARVCALMAEIEEGAGDKGRAREWLARAVRAPRDPAWIADGVISRTWLPVSPATGEIGAFRWAPPPEALGAPVEEPKALEAGGRTGEPALVAPPRAAEEVAASEAAAAGEAEAEDAPSPAPSVEAEEAREAEPSVPAAPVAVPEPAPEPVRASGNGAASPLPRQPDDPGPEPQGGRRRRKGWLARAGGRGDA